MPNENKGFTLLEMAIVVTIIALLISATFVGSSMIRNARLLSVMSDAEGYLKAIQSFKDKYNYMPGDMPNAESFWGSDVSCPNTPYTTAPHTPTCNGDGDGQINPFPSGINEREQFRAWQQLANAGFITGAFTGVPGQNGGCDSEPGVNTPANAVDGNAFFLSYIDAPTGTSVVFPMVGHTINIAAATSISNGCPNQPVISGKEAFMMDSKMDDGMPGTGNVMTWLPAAFPQCANSSDPIAANYIPSDNITCGLLMHTTGF